MKHGVVHSGRTTTYYGNDAQRMMSIMTARCIGTQAEANEAVKQKKSRYARDHLVAALVAVGFKFDAKKIEALNQASDQEEEQARLDAIARHKESYRSFPVSANPTSSKCRFCKRRITKDMDYYDGGPGHRAHFDCCT